MKLLIVLLLFYTSIYSQENKNNYNIITGVKFQDIKRYEPEISNALNTWKSYIISENDSLLIKINTEKKTVIKRFLFPKFLPKKYFTYNIFEFLKVNDGFLFKTFFYYTVNQNVEVLGIYNAYLRKVNQKYLISFDNTTKRKYFKSKNINYYCLKSHKLNKTLIKKANNFCDSINKSFHLKKKKNVSYYINDNQNKSFDVFGFDSYWGITGRYIKKINILIDTKGTEFYKHELVHYLFRDYNSTKFVEEGVAVWLGGSRGKSLQTLVKKIKKEIDYKNEKILKKCLNFKTKDRSFIKYFYTVAGVVMNDLHQKGGNKLILEILTKKHTITELFKKYYLTDNYLNEIIKIIDDYDK